MRMNRYWELIIGVERECIAAERDLPNWSALDLTWHIFSSETSELGLVLNTVELNLKLPQSNAEVRMRYEMRYIVTPDVQFFAYEGAMR